jgi:MFS family permease
MKARRRLTRALSFWVLGALLTLLLFAASAPSPLYGIYQGKWHFSSITLTAIYAVYAFGALAALLTTGRLSDHVGRRRVLVLGLTIQIVGMLAFIAADGEAMLFLGRLLQGVATGIATGAISAWLLDLQPPENPQLGSLVGGIAPLAGLGTGALGASLLVEYGPDPLHLVFWLLGVVFALAVAAVMVIPDPVARRPGWLRSLIPQVGVVPAARSLFVALTPSLIAIWALGGLYLALGPSLAASLLKTDSPIAGGLVIAALLGTGAVASTLARAADPRSMVMRGSVVLVLGVAISLFAVAITSSVGLFAGAVIAGLGFGPAFSGIFRSLAPLAPPDRRGALLAALYFVVYLAFSIPAVIAGIGVNQVGLRDTTYAYGLAVMTLAGLTTAAVSRRKPIVATTA